MVATSFYTFSCLGYIPHPLEPFSLLWRTPQKPLHLLVASVLLYHAGAPYRFQVKPHHATHLVIPQLPTFLCHAQEKTSIQLLQASFHCPSLARCLPLEADIIWYVFAISLTCQTVARYHHCGVRDRQSVMWLLSPSMPHMYWPNAAYNIRPEYSRDSVCCYQSLTRRLGRATHSGRE